MMFLKKQNNPEVSRANPLRARPGDAERQGTIQFSLQMSTEVPASILNQHTNPAKRCDDEDCIFQKSAATIKRSVSW